MPCPSRGKCNEPEVAAVVKQHPGRNVGGRAIWSEGGGKRSGGRIGGRGGSLGMGGWVGDGAVTAPSKLATWCHNANHSLLICND